MSTKRTSASYLAVMAILASSATIGCGAEAERDVALQESGASPQESGEDTGSQAPCRACAPPFVERPAEVEFSGRLIARPAREAEPARDRAARRRLAPNVIRYSPEVDEYILSVPTTMRDRERGSGENRMAAELMATGDYEYVVPDWLCYPTAIPNDPLYATQWHHPKINSAEAWDLQKGSSSLILAFTDTGIDTSHVDLAARRVPGYNSVSELTEAQGGDISDIQGHGTHVAGCAAAIGDNGTGVSGVGWNFKLMMVRVSNVSSGSAYTSDITEGARWAVENGARVVSSSYAGVDSPSVGTTGTYIKSLGGLYLYAAGNSGTNLSWFDHADVIVVGASDQSDGMAWFSSYGQAVDVFAPGVSILSTRNGGNYETKSGTSMATPIANGAVGLIWSVDPTYTPADIEGFLFGGSKDLGSPGDDNTFGWGRIDVYKGVKVARALACTHTACEAGERLGSGCEPCTETICAFDPYCCDTAWDEICVDEVSMLCGVSCN
jgi:subtilisin family serine protease